MISPVLDGFILQGKSFQVCCRLYSVSSPVSFIHLCLVFSGLIEPSNDRTSFLSGTGPLTNSGAYPPTSRLVMALSRNLVTMAGSESRRGLERDTKREG